MPDSTANKDHLIASRPPREARATRAAAVTAVLVHGLAIAAAVWASSVAQDRTAVSEEQITLLQLVDQLPEPPAREIPLVVPQKRASDASSEPAQRRAVEHRARPRVAPAELAPATPKPQKRAEGEAAAAPAPGPVAPAPRDSTAGEVPPVSTAQNEDTAVAGQGTGGGVAGAVDPDAGPVVTLHDVDPALTNQQDVEDALRRAWPRALHQAGIGGRALLWVLIDERGRVVKPLILASSGRQALDQAALAVAPVMRFSPAEYRGKRVKVWVTVPLEFRVN